MKKKHSGQNFELQELAKFYSDLAFFFCLKSVKNEKFREKKTENGVKVFEKFKSCCGIWLKTHYKR